MKKILAFLKKHVVTFVKGIVVGASLRVPGMSGGTTAIILKIYNKLLNAINTFFKNFKENILFLGIFALGGGLGFLALNSGMSYITDTFPAISAYFFAGIILFGLPALFKESGITYRGEKFLTDEKSTKTKKTFIAVLIDLIPFTGGLMIVVAISLLQSQGLLDSSDYTGFAGYIFIIAAGFFAGIAFVLPGLSFTYFLTVIGLMDEFGQSLSFSSMNIGFLLTFAVGLIIGFIATAKILDKLIKKHKRGTYVCIMGFLIGSVVMLLTDSKYVPKINEIGFCILFFALGALLITTITLLANMYSKRSAKTAAEKIQPEAVEIKTEAVETKTDAGKIAKNNDNLKDESGKKK